MLIACASGASASKVQVSIAGASCGVLLTLALISPPAWCDDADPIKVSASIGRIYDDNLFRLPAGADPLIVLGKSSASEVITTTRIGIDFDKEFSRQHLTFSVDGQKYDYRDFGFLNFSALNYTGRWGWGIGKLLSGSVFAERTQVANSYSDFNNFNVRNVRTTSTGRFALDYWFHSSWYAVGGLSHQTLENEQPVLAETDYRQNGYNVGIKYVTASGNSVTSRFNRTDGNNARRTLNAASQVENEFEQNGAELAFRWELTGKSRVNGRTEWISRQHKHFTVRDFEGWVGDITYEFAADGKTGYALTAKRNLSAYQQDSSSYYVANELGLSGRWLPTAKIAVLARVELNSRDFKAPLALPAGVPLREDRGRRASVELSYQPVRIAELRAALAIDRRSGNLPGLDFLSRSASVSADIRF